MPPATLVGIVLTSDMAKPSNPFGPWPPKAGKRKKSQNPFALPKQPSRPAARNAAWEGTLCTAIRNDVLVELWYENDAFARSFAPYVVYRTGTGKVCVFGMQVANTAAPDDRNDPHNFEVGKIQGLILTATRFQCDPFFDLSQAKYRDRICPP